MNNTFKNALIIFLSSICLLNAEITITRLLAYRFFYHYVFLVVSLAQLGLAAAGAWTYVSNRKTWSDDILSKLLYTMSALCMGTLFVYGFFSPDPNLTYAKISGPSSYYYLTSLGILLVSVNICGGMVIVMLFTMHKDKIGKLYGADLLGASLGCVSAVGLMKYNGPIFSYIICACIALMAGYLAGATNGKLSWKNNLISKWAISHKCLFAILPIIIIVALFNTHIFDPGEKGLSKRKKIRTEWTHLARVDATKPGHYIIDGDAATGITQFSRLEEISEYIIANPFPETAIIGVGAGPQLLEALWKGKARSVLAIDINETIIKWVNTIDSKATLELFKDPDVTVKIGEGRHSLRSSPKNFDLVIMHAIDTWTSSSQGAYSMTENFLYTKEAVKDMLSKLNPNGIISLKRWLFWPPRENLRLFITIFQALKESGLKNPEKQILVISPVRDYKKENLFVWGHILISNSPFVPERLKRLDEHIEKNKRAYVYKSSINQNNPFYEYVKSPNKEVFYDSYPYVVTPASDNNPFFFQFAKPWSNWTTHNDHIKILYGKSTFSLLLCLVLVTALTILLLGIPMYLRRNDLQEDPLKFLSPLYFGCLGIGFMAFELPMIQTLALFLGHPTYALSVVLLGLLAFAGLGSTLVDRVGDKNMKFIFALIIVTLGSNQYLLPFVHANIHLPESIRFFIAFLFLAVIGIPLGMPLVAGMKLLDPNKPHQVSWAWAVNGAAGVWGSVLVMIAMVYLGSRSALIASAVFYSMAFLIKNKIASVEYAQK